MSPFSCESRDTSDVMIHRDSADRIAPEEICTREPATRQVCVAIDTKEEAHCE